MKPTEQKTQPVPDTTTVNNSLAEYHQGQLAGVLTDLRGIEDGLCSLFCSFESLLEQSVEGPRHLLRLLLYDVTSLRDDVQRHLEGRCQIRGLAFNSLRPPKDHEEFHHKEMERIHAGGVQC